MLTRRVAFNTTNRFLGYLPFLLFLLIFGFTYYLIYLRSPSPVKNHNPLLEKKEKKEEQLPKKIQKLETEMPPLGPNDSLPLYILEKISKKLVKIPAWKDTEKIKQVKLFKEFDVQSEFSTKYVPYFKLESPHFLPETKATLCTSPQVGYFTNFCTNRKTVISNWESEINSCTERHVSCTVSPFCTPHNYPSKILEISNGYVVSGKTNVKYQIFNDGYILQSQYSPYDDNPNVGLAANIHELKVVDIKTPLATAGIAYFDNEFAHFPLEYLPQLLRLHTSLPSDVSILWPNTEVSKKIYHELIINGIMNSDRKIIYAEDNTIYRSDRLYFHHFLYKKSVVTPVNLMLTNKLLTKKFEKKKPKNTILLVSRRDRKTRRLENHDEIKKKLIEKFSDKYQVIDIVGGELAWFKAGKHFYNAKLIISPYGATLSHLLFSRSCSSVMEIGYLPLSDEYFCLARNIGSKYGYIIARGSYGTDMLPDVDQILNLAEILINKSTC